MSRTRAKMLSVLLSALAACWLAAAPAGAQERQEFSLSEVQAFSPQTISSSGRVQAVVCAAISPRVSGHIAAFGKDGSGATLEEGSIVKAGDVLFRLEDKTFRNAVAMADASLKTAQAHLDNLTAKTRPEQMEQLRQAIAELDVRVADRKREEERFRRLVEQDKTLPIKRLEDVQTEVAALEAQRKSAGARLQMAENGPTETEIAVARAQVYQAQAALRVAQTDLDDSVIKAPFAGLISRRYKSVGAYASSGPPTDVVELTALDKLEVELRVSESYMAAIQPGKTTVVLRSGLLQAQLRAPVARVVGSVDSSSGTFAVRIAVPAGSGLPPGAFVTAELKIGASGSGVLVPTRALLNGPEQSSVFVAQDGKAVRRTVEVCDRLTEFVIVKGVLEEGAKVLVGPVQSLKDGSPLPEYLHTVAAPKEIVVPAVAPAPQSQPSKG